MTGHCCSVEGIILFLLVFVIVPIGSYLQWKVSDELEKNCEWIQIESMELVKDRYGHYYVYYNKGNAYFGGHTVKKIGDDICVYNGDIVK